MYRAIMNYVHNEVKLNLKKDLDEAADNGDDDSALILLKCILYRSADNDETREWACERIRDHLPV
jgi:hypothetical protein